ncbi:MAG: hypothetical protein ACYSXF_06540, partial [Planctomycetota bacterium]
MRRLRRVSTLCVASCVGLCGCKVDEKPPSASTRDSAGIQIIESVRPLWGDQEGWHVVPEPSLTIGGGDGPGEELLHDVRGVVRLDDGDVALANAGSSELRFYDSDGSFRAGVGGEGQGPGEFCSIRRLWKMGDSLYVYDFQQGNRVSVFTVDGTFVLQSPPGGGVPLDAGPFYRGQMLV